MKAPDDLPPCSPLEPVVDRPRPHNSPLSGRWWRNAVFYEIFVRSFSDSNQDGIGDFAGLTDRLDYLNDGRADTDTDLGVDALWLMPIKASPSYHGYDVVDYRAVNPDYGTMADFERLLAEAHRRGIRVVIDFVLNHAGRTHPWFVDAQNPKSKYRDYFVFRDAPNPAWKRPWDGANVWHPAKNGGVYYGLFWSGMPDWNLAHPDVQVEMIDAMKFWLARGVDGFRIDAARYLMEREDGQLADLPETHAYLRRIRRELEAEYPEALLVVEVWSDTDDIASYYGDGQEAHLAFSFDVAGKVKEAAKDGLRAPFNQMMHASKDTFSDRNFEAPFLSNHDMQRVMQTLNGDEGAARVAVATLFALPGTPFVYYGEEIGMQGGRAPKDEDKRTPMRWSAEGPGYGFTTASKSWYGAEEAPNVAVSLQQTKANSLWTLYRDLIRLRHEQAALGDGVVHMRKVTGGGRGVTAVLRVYQDNEVLFVVNFDRSPAKRTVVSVRGTPQHLFGDEGVKMAMSKDGLELTGLGPQSFVFIQL